MSDVVRSSSRARSLPRNVHLVAGMVPHVPKLHSSAAPDRVDRYTIQERCVPSGRVQVETPGSAPVKFSMPLSSRLLAHLRLPRRMERLQRLRTGRSPWVRAEDRRPWPENSTFRESHTALVMRALLLSFSTGARVMYVCCKYSAASVSSSSQTPSKKTSAALHCRAAKSAMTVSSGETKEPLQPGPSACTSSVRCCG